MSDKHDKDLERATRELFRREVESLDAATRSKLNQARQQALAELERPTPFLLRAPLPQAAAAAIAVAVLGGVFVLRDGGFESDGGVPEIAAVSDFEILLAEDDMAFLEEIEFYAWLESQPEFAGLEDAEEGAG